MPFIPSSKVLTGPKWETRRVAFNIVEERGGLDPVIILPPLYMHHNPQDFKENFVKKTTRIQTFDSYVEFYWGEELDTISCSATTGGFILDDYNGMSTGLTTFHRRKTKPYFKFQDVLDVYQNNGNKYDEQGRVVSKGFIEMFFDPNTHFGYFEKFDYREEADNPYVFHFDFVFKVEKSYTGF